MRLLTIALSLIISVLVFLHSFSAVLAQDLTTMGIAQDFPISGEDVKSGHIVSLSSKGYVISTFAYDPSMIGVVSTFPAIGITTDDGTNLYQVVSTGIANVLVSGGPIAVGDLITSSTTPGVGMKADKSGFILGSAQEAFNPQSPNEIGTIQVSLTLRYIISGSTNAVVLKSLKDIVSFSTIAAIESPTEIFRYVLAGFILLATTAFSIFTFGRNASLGIEALGRNPRAGQKIILGIMINVITSVSILAVGLAAAYFTVALNISGGS